MVSYEKQAGTIEVIENDTSVVVSLFEYVGTLKVGLACETLRISVKGNCELTNDISLTNHEKIDIIKIVPSEIGHPHIRLKSLKASSVIVNCDCDINLITANVIRIENATCNTYVTDSNSHSPLSSVGHAWIVDSTYNCSKFDYGADVPYLLVDNSDININAKIKVVNSDNEISLSNIAEYTYLEPNMMARCSVRDDTKGTPKQFQYVILKNQDGSYSGIVDRRKLYTYIPAVLATPYDKFKHSTQFTNVDLHRWIDQHADEPVEGEGIPNSTIDKICRGEEFKNGEDPQEIPDSVIDQICNGTYVFDGHPHESIPMRAYVIDEIMRGTYHFENESELYRQNYSLIIQSLESYRTSQVPLYHEAARYREEHEIP